jgi:predicted RND superfamily exporter protein
MIMDALQLHLLTNHVPIVGTFAALLVVIVGMIRRSDAAISAGLIVYAAMAMVAIPAYLSGEEAEERVEHIAGINEGAIHEHEEMAELSLWFTVISGVLGAVIAHARNMKVSSKIALAFVIMAMVAFAQAARTGHEGGMIRRPDLGTTPAPTHEAEHE